MSKLARPRSSPFEDWAAESSSRTDLEDRVENRALSAIQAVSRTFLQSDGFPAEVQARIMEILVGQTNVRLQKRKHLFPSLVCSRLIYNAHVWAQREAAQD